MWKSRPLLLEVVSLCHTEVSHFISPSGSSVLNSLWVLCVTFLRIIFKKLIGLKWKKKFSISEFNERLSLYWGPPRPTQNLRQGRAGAGPPITGSLILGL